MKKLFLPFLLFMVTSLFGAEPVFVAGLAARQVNLSKAGTATGVLVYGGIGNQPDGTWAGKIVLLDRGTISYSAKVATAQIAGAIGVVIANNVAGVDNVSLDAGTTSVVPVLGVTQAIGTQLKARVGESVRVGSAAPVIVTPAFTLPDPKGHAGETLQSDGDKYVFVKVASAPVVIAADENVTLGGNLTFSVTADGYPAPTWQWLKDKADIAGATGNQFQIIGAQGTDAGRYSCRATNEVGSVMSNELGLSVTQ